SPFLFARRFKFAVVDEAQALAKRTASLAKEYTIRPITISDFPHLMDLSEGFAAEEPLLKAVGANLVRCRRTWEHIFIQSIASQEILNTSLIAFHKASGAPVGYRMYYPVWRDD
ncbi:hypothetical protein PFISCL1PPCAC_15883, partial [Pristionchus fissidentatus]